MATDQEVGSVNIRTNFYDKTIRGRADATYKFKQAVSVVSTSAWTNYFYRESTTVLAGATGNNTKEIPRGAAFPQAVVQWDRISTNILKFGLEDNIYWEDILSDDLDVQARTLFRIAEGVVKAVDDEIWRGLGGTLTLTDVTSFSIVGRQWDVASATIIDDLMRAKQLIAEQNYDTNDLMLFVSPKDHRSIVSYLAEKGAQFPSIGEDVAMNGRAGRLAGIQIVVSNSVTASNAMVVVPKVCATWRELVPLKTTTIEDPYKGVTVRAVEEGTIQLTDPKAVIMIRGTQA